MRAITALVWGLRRVSVCASPLVTQTEPKAVSTDPGEGMAIDITRCRSDGDVAGWAALLLPHDASRPAVASTAHAHVARWRKVLESPGRLECPGVPVAVAVVDWVVDSCASRPECSRVRWFWSTVPPVCCAPEPDGEAPVEPVANRRLRTLCEKSEP